MVRYVGQQPKSMVSIFRDAPRAIEIWWIRSFESIFSIFARFRETGCERWAFIRPQRDRQTQICCKMWPRVTQKLCQVTLGY